MKEKIIELVCERANISEDAATKAVDAVFGFLKEHPDQVTGLLGDFDAGDALSSVTKLFGR